jgi:hypothetical protein
MTVRNYKLFAKTKFDIDTMHTDCYGLTLLMVHYHSFHIYLGFI